METKICTKCKVEYEASAKYFYKDKNRKDGLYPQCKECVKERSRRWNFENKEKHLEYNKMWRKENESHVREYEKSYYQENESHKREYTKSYYQENAERRKRYSRLYRENNKTKRLEYNRKYREENKEYHRSYMRRRNSHKRNLASTLTINQWRHAQSYFNHNCAYCGSATTLEQEHFWPLSKGGGYTRTNIIPACRSCNASKNNKPFEEWYPTHESYSPEREAKIYQYFEQLALENGGWGRQRYDLGVVTIEVSHEDL